MPAVKIHHYLASLGGAALLALSLPAMADMHGGHANESFRQKAPENAEVYIVSPKDGETVSNPVRVVFGLRGMGVAPAGVEMEHTGHHHLLVDAPVPTGDDLEMPLPADDRHIHFGGGQTETEITLAPGRHTLQLLLGDHNHIPHDPVIASDVITIEVRE